MVNHIKDNGCQIKSNHLWKINISHYLFRHMTTIYVYHFNKTAYIDTKKEYDWNS